MKITKHLVVMLFMLPFTTQGQNHEDLQDGDIIFQQSQSSLSKAIQLATKSRYSHVGIIYIIDKQPYVYEAVQPVKLTRLTEWIARGEKHHYVVKRLKNSQALLTKESIAQMRKSGEKFKGKDYDHFFGWSNERMYCSELVWKIYKENFNLEIGELQPLKSFDLSNPLVVEKLKAHYGNNIPLEEKIISPVAMFESPLLEVVMEN